MIKQNQREKNRVWRRERNERTECGTEYEKRTELILIFFKRTG